MIKLKFVGSSQNALHVRKVGFDDNEFWMNALTPKNL